MEEGKAKDVESIGYVIFSEYFSAILALRVLNSKPESDRIITAKICSSRPALEDGKLFCEPLIHPERVDDMVYTV